LIFLIIYEGRSFVKKSGKGEIIMAQVKKVGEIWKCNICGNVVVVKEAGGGELVCCQQPMQKIKVK